MKLSQQATKGHLFVGAFLVLLSLASLLAALFLQAWPLSLSIFLFGVWGGVELGRYLEHWLSPK